MFSRNKPVSELSFAPPRNELLRIARVAILDDKIPEMLQDLQQSGLAIDHLKSTEDQRFSRLEEGFYDLLLLDYGGIGQKYGSDEGLDVLKHLNRVCPSLRVLAFTSLTFDSSKASFFRDVKEVLRKDIGIASTLEVIERHLNEVLTPAHQFQSLRDLLKLQNDDRTTKKLDRLLTKSAGKPNALASIKDGCKKMGYELVSKAGEAAATKCMQLIISALTSGA